MPVTPTCKQAVQQTASRLLMREAARNSKNMEAANRPSILIVEPNKQLREEIFNFLLSAGYEELAATDSLPSALGKISQSDFDVTLSDAGKPLTAGLQFAKDLAEISPNTRIIFMINPEDRQLWDQVAERSDNIRFLIKTDFSRNLLYLLEEDTQWPAN